MDLLESPPRVVREFLRHLDSDTKRAMVAGGWPGLSRALARVRRAPKTIRRYRVEDADIILGELDSTDIGVVAAIWAADSRRSVRYGVAAWAQRNGFELDIVSDPLAGGKLEAAVVSRSDLFASLEGQLRGGMWVGREVDALTATLAQLGVDDLSVVAEWVLAGTYGLSVSAIPIDVASVPEALIDAVLRQLTNDGVVRLDVEQLGVVTHPRFRGVLLALGTTLELSDALVGSITELGDFEMSAPVLVSSWTGSPDELAGLLGDLPARVRSTLAVDVATDSAVVTAIAETLAGDEVADIARGADLAALLRSYPDLSPVALVQAWRCASAGEFDSWMRGQYTHRSSVGDGARVAGLLVDDDVSSYCTALTLCRVMGTGAASTSTGQELLDWAWHHEGWTEALLSGSTPIKRWVAERLTTSFAVDCDAWGTFSRMADDWSVSLDALVETVLTLTKAGREGRED